ncbi:MAG: RNA methyltransferase [Vicinamibacterales bacterium]
MPPVSRIDSRQHAAVKRCRALAHERDDQFVLLDGEHLVVEALRADVPIEMLLTDDTPRPDLTSRADNKGVVRYEGTSAVLEAASPVRTPSGVVALARWSPMALEAVLDTGPALVVGLVGVQDPGNVGAVIRAADALGASGVVILEGTADPGHWKSLRGAMGSTFRIPIARDTLDRTIARARQQTVLVAATVASGGAPIERVTFGPAMLLLLGNEGAGLSAATVARSDVQLTIPMRAGVDSLNVSVTAALCLWQARLARAAANGTSV